MKYQGESIIAKNTRYTYQKGRGVVQEDIFQGTQAGIMGIWSEMAAIADEFDVSHEGPVYTARCRYSAVTEPTAEGAVVDDIRVSANRVVKKPWHHPRYSSLWDTDQLELIRRTFDTSKPFSDISGQVGALGAELWDKLVRDEGFTVYQPVIQRTWTAGSSYNFNLPYYTNVGSIFLSTQMVAELAVPGNVLGFPFPTETHGDGVFEYGWLKHYPEYFKGAGQKAVMSQDYEYGLWDLDLYDIA